MWRTLFLVALMPTCALSAPVRDLSVPLVSINGFDQARLVGDWFEVAQTPSFLEQDCHGTTAAVALRDDSRLTLKIACHKTSLAGPVLRLEGILVETDPGAFQMRLMNLQELGNLPLVVLWQAADDSMAAIGAPGGEIGWIWAKSAHPDPQALEEAKQALIGAGYRVTAIRSVDQAP